MKLELPSNMKSSSFVAKLPKAMAASMLPGYIESSKPFNRRIHHDVAGARMLTMPKLYRDGEDYMSTRVKMRSRR